MLNNLEPEKESAQEEVLCGKSEKIDMDIPFQDITIRFDYKAYETAARQKQGLMNIANCLSVQNSSLSLEKQKADVLHELAVFKADNAELASDKRFSDAYYFHLAEFYSLLKDYKNEEGCLSHINDRQNPAYAAKIAENELRKNENKQENLIALYNLNTAESARKLSGYYLAQNDFQNAKKILSHYIETHDEIPFEIYSQYGFLFIRTGDASKAIHYFRLSFYEQNTALSATTLSMLYLVQAIKNAKLAKKACLWCEIAVNIDISFTPAVRLLVNLELESCPQKTETLLSKYLSLHTAHDDGFYFGAAINYAKCAFVKGKYGEALERLSPLTEDKTDSAAVWNNIALCNASIGKPEKLARAERNIVKSLEKFKEKDASGKNPKELEIILTNYMRILNRQGKFKETLSLFENTENAKNFTLTENSYLNYFAEYKKALVAEADFDTYFDFANQVFTSPNSNANVKLYACNDILSVFTVVAPEEKKSALLSCLEFLKNLLPKEPSSKRRTQILNNIVYTSLELGEEIPAEIIEEFSSTVGQTPYNAATFGLYLIRRKNQTERGFSYYDKSVKMAQADKNYANLTERLRLKKDLETARILIQNGDGKSARRLLENVQKRCSQSLQGYRQNAARLLEEL